MTRPLHARLRAVIVPLLVALAPLPATAQDEPGATREPEREAPREMRIRPISPVVKYGKWALLAGSLGMNVAAARAHDASERTIDELESYCEADIARCATLPDGSYVDPAAEGLFQATLDHDRRARRWLVGGEAALLGAAALFIWEFTRPKAPPANIPFEPEVSVRNGTTRLGVRIDW